MAIAIETITYPNRSFSANTYLIPVAPGQVVVVDPGQSGNGLSEYLHKSGQVPVAILLTHGHFDHLRGVIILVEEYALPVYLAAEEYPFLANRLFGHGEGEELLALPALTPIYDGEVLHFGALDITVIATPFHTPGSVCYYLAKESLLFSGDTLFKRSVGRTDFLGGEPRLMAASLRKLIALPPQTRVYPGHEGQTTIGEEIKFNRFIAEI